MTSVSTSQTSGTAQNLPAAESLPARPNPYTQPAFIAAVVILLAAATGLNFAVGDMKLHFKKAPVPLARPLTEIAPRMGDWLQVSRDEPMEPDLEEVLGTNQYVFRDYLKVSAYGGQCAGDFIEALHAGESNEKLAELKGQYLDADPAAQQAILAAELKDKSTNQRKAAVGMVQRIYPDAVINMAVTYYTGMADTVAHIPDRCYIADGFEPTEYTVPTWTLADGRRMEVRFINFQDTGDMARPDRNVGYFFQVNGHYVSNPLEVRASLQNLFQKYGYYAKVELMTMDSNRDRSSATMTGFLSSSLSEVEKSFPDWKKIIAGAGNKS